MLHVLRWRQTKSSSGSLLMPDPALVTHHGGCHCGAVQFEVAASAKLEVDECNCSMCQCYGYQHLIVPKSRFSLTTDRAALTRYQFNTHTAEHFFCRVCGVKSFYIPRSHPEGISVNARCLADDTIEAIAVRPFDGKNWEANVEYLAPLEN